jgi:hypothetical protein
VQICLLPYFDETGVPLPRGGGGCGMGKLGFAIDRVGVSCMGFDPYFSCRYMRPENCIRNEDSAIQEKIAKLSIVLSIP